MENSSPNPSFSICDIQIQKQMSRSFGKSFPQKIVLPKLRPHCSATCLNTWKAEPPKEKTPFLFKKKFTPPTKKKRRGVFFWGCPPPLLFKKNFPPRQTKKGRGVFVRGLPGLWEEVAERYERTRQFQATTRRAS